MTMIIKCAIIYSVEFVFQRNLLKKALKSKILLFSFSIFFILFNSCKNTTETKLVYTESDTIKKSVKEKEENITWTNELEGERLTQIINRNSIQVGQEVIYNKDLYKISIQPQHPVYPNFSDFGSLDTSTLKPHDKEKINNFCKALSSKEQQGAEAFFNRKYLFNYIFFLEALKAGWQNNFNQAIPANSELFNKWLFGEPFYGSDILQIPVRFYADCGTIDMTVFLNSSGNNEIYQITINRWKKV